MAETARTPEVPSLNKSLWFNQAKAHIYPFMLFNLTDFGRGLCLSDELNLAGTPGLYNDISTNVEKAILDC